MRPQGFELTLHQHNHGSVSAHILIYHIIRKYNKNNIKRS
jgi:hypothetical protein